MRLIDADALKTKAIKCETFKLTDAPVFFKAVGTKEIDKAPTIDAEPVRHGHWDEWDDTMFNTVYRCSVCGEDFVLIDGTLSDNLYNYCPNCGAKMDEVSDE